MCLYTLQNKPFVVEEDIVGSIKNERILQKSCAIGLCFVYWWHQTFKIMCLKTTNDIIKNATEPVECYKVLCVWKDKEDYWSPTFAKQYEIGEEYIGLFGGDGHNRFYEGFHAFVTYNGAYEYLDMLLENSDENDIEELEAIVIAKCEVPVGGCYFIGEDECSGISALVCNKFKINEIVNRFTKTEM